MDALPRKIAVHCRKNKITWTFEQGLAQVEFVAPKGKVFPNESRYRILDIEGELECNSNPRALESLVWSLDLK